MFNNKIELMIPARLHMSVLDMNKFDLGVCGGGGIGLALQLYTKIHASFNEKEDAFIGNYKNIAKIYLDYIKKVFGLEQYHFKIEISQDFPSHVGLGSTGGAIIGVILAISRLCNLKPSYHEILDIFLANIVEEHDNQITKCFETCVGPWANLKGGLVLVDTNCKMLANYDIDNSYEVLIIFPDGSNISSSIQEEEILLDGKGKEYDTRDFKIKSSLMDELINYVNLSDTTNILKIINRFKMFGSKLAEVEFQDNINKGLYTNLIKISESCNICLSGVSSIGPCFFCIDKSNTISKLANKLNEMNLNIKTIRTNLHNEGCEL